MKNFSVKEISSNEFLAKGLIPPDTEAHKLKVQIIPAGRSGPVLAEANIRLTDKASFIAVPAKSSIETNSSISFSLGAFSNKTLNGKFQEPIRCKIYNPDGEVVVNRAITTDFNGLATFTTEIHRLTNQGRYSFEFSHMGNVQRYLLPISQAPSHSSGFKLLKEENPKQMILDIQPNPNSLSQGVVQYNCTGGHSIYAQAWQMGKLLFNGKLESCSGIAVLPYESKASESYPILFVFSMLKDGIMYTDSRRVFYGTNKGNRVSELLTEGSSAVSPKNRLSFMKEVFDTEVFFKTTYKSLNNQEKETRILEVEGVESKNFKDPEKENNSLQKSRFFLVNEELELSKYSFEIIRLWQDVNGFTENFLKLSKEYNYGFDEFLEVAILISNLSKEVKDNLRGRLIEHLEGFVAPTYDFYTKIKNNPTLYSRYETRLKETIYYLAENVTIPKKLSMLIEDTQSLEAAISGLGSSLATTMGSALNNSLRIEKHSITHERKLLLPSFFSQGINYSNLQNGFQKGGKAILLTNNQCINLNLLNPLYSFNTKILTKSKNDIINKLINLRTSPLIAELVFN